MTVATLNYLIGVSTVLMQIVSVGLIALYFLREETFGRLVAKYALIISFSLAFGGVVMSLVYSEYFGIVPCGLCWLSRIALYPQALIFFIAVWKKDTEVALYAIALSLFGLAVSVYHHYIQMGGTSVLPCPASGVSDCAKRFMFEFGYVTFPLVGATTFVLIIILMVFVMRHNKLPIA